MELTVPSKILLKYKIFWKRIHRTVLLFTRAYSTSVYFSLDCDWLSWKHSRSCQPGRDVCGRSHRPWRSPRCRYRYSLGTRLPPHWCQSLARLQFDLHCAVKVTKIYHTLDCYLWLRINSVMTDHVPLILIAVLLQFEATKIKWKLALRIPRLTFLK